MVDASASIRRGHPVIFTFLAFTSFVYAVIASTLTSDYNKNSAQTAGLNGSVRYSVFVGWWTFVFSILYLVLFLTGKGGVVTSIAGHGIWIFLTWLFTLAAAGAVTDRWRNVPDVDYSSSLQALMAFEWMSWIVLTFLLVIVAIIGSSSFRGGRGLKEGLDA